MRWIDKGSVVKVGCLEHKYHEALLYDAVVYRFATCFNCQ